MKKKVFVAILTFCLFIGQASAAPNFSCEDISNTGRILGQLFRMVSVLVPALTLVLGSTDLVKAVAAGSDDGIKKAQKTLFQRILWCVVFFLLITIVNLVLGLIGITDATCNFF